VLLRGKTILSSFESIEDVASNTTVSTRGWNITTSATSATVTGGIAGIVLATGATSGEKAVVEATPFTGFVDWAKNPCFSMICKLSSNENHTTFIGIGDYDAGTTENYIGFEIVGSTLNAVVSDGTTETNVSISGITVTNDNVYSAIMTSPSSGTASGRVDFYINQDPVASVQNATSTILPTGTDDVALQMRIINSTTADKTLTVYNTSYGQSI